MKIRKIILLLMVSSIIIATFTCCEREQEPTSIVTMEVDTCEAISETKATETVPSNWKLEYYVDEFGDYDLNSPYALGSFDGTFSNSATTGSKLTVCIYLDPEYSSWTQIRLIEYGSSIARFSSSDTITLKTKDSSGEENSYTLTYYNDDLYSFESSLRDAIENNETLSIYISAESSYSTTIDKYRFKTDNIGLSEILSEIYK